jgi:3-oxoadipate enol-lactonase
MILAYNDNGPGPVVVLLHGFPLDRSMWSWQETTIGSIYRVITPDLRGHGQSAAPEGIYTMEAMAEDVIETLDALQLTEPVVLGGLSMGGYVALALVARYPERFRALMLIDTKAEGDTPEAAAARRALAERLGTEGHGFLVDQPPPLLREDAPPELRDRVKTWIAEQTPAAIAAAALGMAERPDSASDLATIDVPTLVITGAEDRLIPPDVTAGIAEGVDGAELLRIEGAGHLSNLEAPEAFDTALGGVLTGLGL